jgi:hypothetical protein
MSDPMKTENCAVCGAPLVYFTQKQKNVCQFCGREFEIDAMCEKGHYVCDECHARNAIEAITGYMMCSDSDNPVEMAIEIMQHPSIKMHGPEHHYLVPAALLSAYCNRSGLQDKKAEYLAEAKARASKVPGGFCGFNGACGAGIGTGIFISIISGATPISKIEWKMSNMMTSESLVNIAIHADRDAANAILFLRFKRRFNSRYVTISVCSTVPIRLYANFPEEIRNV